MLLAVMLLAVVVMLVLVVTVGVVHITGVKARRLSPFKVPVVTTGDYVGNISICVGETRHVWAGRGEDTGRGQGQGPVNAGGHNDRDTEYM